MRVLCGRLGMPEADDDRHRLVNDALAIMHSEALRRQPV